MNSEATVDAQQLFGSVRRMPVIGNLPLPLARLRAPLPPPDPDGGEYGCYLFCAGCGTVQPVLKRALPHLTGETRDSYLGMFLRAERCDIDGSDELTGLALLPVPPDS